MLPPKRKNLIDLEQCNDMITICQNVVKTRWLVAHKTCPAILSTSKESLLIFSGCLTAWAHGWCRATNPIKFTGTFRQTMSVSSAEVIWLSPSWIYTLIITLDNMPLQFLNFPAEERALLKKRKSKTPKESYSSLMYVIFLFDSYLSKCNFIVL